MKFFNPLKNQKGIAIISVYMVSTLITTISAAAFVKSYWEMHQVEMEADRLASFAAAEAGIQRALSQIGNNAYTGFINTAAMSLSLQDASATSTIGTVNVSFSYPNQADWVTVESTATVNNETRTLEGRVFLDSNLSKFLVYANTATFSSGDNAQYGEPDMTDTYGDGTPDYPEYVPSNEKDRASLYFTGDWTISGSSVDLYGDANVQGGIAGNSSSTIHGDSYVGNFVKNTSGAVTNSGVTGGLHITDGFDDDVDRNGSGTITSADYPDYHDLTSTGGGDDHATETLNGISDSFYSSHNNIPAFSSTTQNRYIRLEAINGGTTTRVVEYTNASFTTQSSTYVLPSNAIVYIKGNAYVKGQIGGRVSIVSSQNIYFDGNVTYDNGRIKADVNHSVAFLAQDGMYFRPNDLSVSGILYANNSGSTNTVAMDSSQNLSGQTVTTKGSLSLFGNRVMNGNTSMSQYTNRTYGYDSNLKYFRPPGIPVVPDLRTVREARPQSEFVGP